MDWYEVDPANSLTLRWVPDDEPDVGLLVVTAAASGYAGRAETWLNGSKVRKWAESLTTYPPRPRPQTLSAVYRGASYAHEVVGLAVQPWGARGQVGVAVHLMSPWLDSQLIGPSFEVRLDLLTTFERLNHFSQDLLALLDGAADQAVLGSEELA